jgi:hypothetical protein
MNGLEVGVLLMNLSSSFLCSSDWLKFKGWSIGLFSTGRGLLNKSNDGSLLGIGLLNKSKDGSLLGIG